MLVVLICLHKKINIEKLHAEFSPPIGCSSHAVWLIIFLCHQCHSLTTFPPPPPLSAPWPIGAPSNFSFYPSTWGSFLPPCISMFPLHYLEDFYSSLKMHFNFQLLLEMLPESFRQKESCSSLFRHPSQHASGLCLIPSWWPIMEGCVDCKQPTQE